MALLESAFFKAGLYAAAALIGYRQGADVPGLGFAIDSFCEALGGLLNRRARGQAARIADGLKELARAERIKLRPIEATLEDLFARHGLQAPELIDLGLDPAKAAALVRARGAALFTGLDAGQSDQIMKALEVAYATLIKHSDFLETAQATVLRALLAQHDTIERLPPATASAVRALLGGNLLDGGQRLLPPEPRESLLLRAEYGVVPFDPSRQRDLDDLLAWCRQDPAKSIRLITGAGGMGKTRLALELASRLRLDDWHAGFLLRNGDGALCFPFDELLDANRNLLVIVDYAETRRATVEDLLRRLALHPTLCRRRVLLLARAAGDWWNDLRTRDGDVRDLFERLGGASLEMRLSALAAALGQRARSFAAAREAFANRLGLAAAPRASLPDLAQPHFAQGLYLHVAALASLSGDRLETEDELLDWVLSREEATWRKALDALDLPTARFFDPFAQGAALLTLVGGVATSVDAWNLLRRVPTLADQPNVVLETMVCILAGLYPDMSIEHANPDLTSRIEPGKSLQIAGVRPDLLGEQLVDRRMRRDDCLLDVAFGAPADENLITRVLTVLNRLAQRRPDSTRWLHLAFERHLETLAEPALQVAIEGGDPIGQVLTTTLEKERRWNIALRLANCLPKRTVALRELSSVVTMAVIAFMRMDPRATDTSNRWKLAMALNGLGFRLNQLGRLDEALACGEECVDILDAMPDTWKKRSEPFLITARINLSNHLIALERYDEGGKNATAALRIAKRLARRQPARFKRDLARCYATLGSACGMAQRFREACTITKKAVEIRRRLAKMPNASKEDLADFAGTLINYAKWLEGLRCYDDALLANQETVEMFEKLASHSADEYEAELALALQNLGWRLQVVGRLAEAVLIEERAVVLHHRLASVRPIAFGSAYAASLLALGTFVCGENPTRARQCAEEGMRLLTSDRQMGIIAPNGLVKSLTELHRLAVSMRE